MTTASEISWSDLKAMILGLADQTSKTDLQMQETDRRMQETDRMIKELRESGKETDRRMQETDRRMQETDRQMQETDRRMKETDRQIKDLGKQIGGLGDKFGSFTEGMAMPSMERILLGQFGMENVSPRHRVRRLGREQEYDVLAWANGQVNTAVVVEIKSRVRSEAIAQLIQQLESLFDFMPEIAGKRRIGILSGVDWVPGVAEDAQRQGVYTATIHDDVFELTTPPDFVPRTW